MVCLAGSAVLYQQSIGPNDIAYIGEVAASFEIANGHGCGSAAFIGRNPAGDGRSNETVGLSRSEMVETAR